MGEMEVTVLEKQGKTETVEHPERKTSEAPSREMAPGGLPGIESWIVPLLLIEGDDRNRELHKYEGGD